MVSIPLCSRRWALTTRLLDCELTTAVLCRRPPCHPLCAVETDCLGGMLQCGRWRVGRCDVHGCSACAKRDNVTGRSSRESRVGLQRGVSTVRVSHVSLSVHSEQLLSL